MCANLQTGQQAPREGFVPIEIGKLFYREIGEGPPVIILHGGMDLDHTYLLPDMDRLGDGYRLIYYDQRGRGRSTGEVENICIQSEMEDLERVREHFGLDRVAVLGHSWGGLLAMEYAIRYPQRVSHIILMSTGPATHDDFNLYRQEWHKRRASYEEELKAIDNSEMYKQGDPQALAASYRIYFTAAIKRPEDVDRVNLALDAFTKESVLRGRQIEGRLFDETWGTKGYDLLPKLKELSNPTLIIHGDYDFIPVETVARIAEAMPGARFVVLEDCGHFTYVERPDEVRKEMADFFQST